MAAKGIHRESKTHRTQELFLWRCHHGLARGPAYRAHRLVNSDRGYDEDQHYLSYHVLLAEAVSRMIYLLYPEANTGIIQSWHIWLKMASWPEQYIVATTGQALLETQREIIENNISWCWPSPGPIDGTDQCTLNMLGGNRKRRPSKRIHQTGNKTTCVRSRHDGRSVVIVVISESSVTHSHSRANKGVREPNSSAIIILQILRSHVFEMRAAAKPAVDDSKRICRAKRPDMSAMTADQDSVREDKSSIWFWFSVDTRSLDPEGYRV